MGCDIHTYTERKTEHGYERIDFSPFDWRSYGMYGFLAGVRNYSDIIPISEPRDIPEDCSKEISEEVLLWDGVAHSKSWLSVKELSEFNYDAEMEDRRVMINNNGGSTCEEGAGQKMTYREFLGSHYFDDLNKLKELGAARVVFWFDN